MDNKEIRKKAYQVVLELEKFKPKEQTPITPESISKMIYQVKIDESNIEPIHTIINKEHYTGKDLGIISQYERFRQLELYKKYDKNPEPTNPDKVIKEFKKIKDEQHHHNVMVGYESIFNWLTKNFNYELANIQQRTSKYNYILSKVREIQLTENVLLFKSNTELTKDFIGRFEIYKNKFKDLSIDRYLDTIGEKLRETHINNVKDGETRTLQSYRYIKCWNIAVSLIAEYYNIPFIYSLKYEYVKAIEREYNEYNQLLKDTETDIKELNKDSNIRDKKIKAFKEIFKPIKYEDIKIEPEIVEKARKQFNYTNFDSFVYNNFDIMEILTKQI